MKKIALIGLVAVFAVLAVGFAAAQGYGRNSVAPRNTDFHTAMYDIMENGTYNDLEAFREESGFNVMPWVQSEEDFALAKEMHERMESYREQNGPGYGMMGGQGAGRGYGRAGGCPMAAGYR